MIQKTAGMLEVDAVTSLTAQIVTMQNMVNVVYQPPTWCEICGGCDHSAEVCGTNPNYVNFKRNTEYVSKESEPKESEVVAQEERVQPIVKPPPPFPQKFKKQNEDECFGKFLSILKQIHINLPLLDVLQGIPRYAKYVKEIVANKKRMMEYETIALTEYVEHSCPKPTTILLQLADRSLARPEGVVEEVLVQVGSLIFPVDFVVLNFKPDPKVPFILGRHFLATGRAMIDVAAGQLTMRAHDKVEVFDVYKALKLPAVYEELSAIIMIDLEAEALYIASKDPLE
ncbi:hypothetical protein R3W88_000887 [Solanum pinnatisectum]|uniref:Uncharacterized protein n=1 Tax=Solanum pinnatisectum TaxID=50273 RepID=A0AAV9MJL0_9SOLN|nr:hypothetical protein R3W88_000887 [Solanum pinnatisectum]